jgi:hypothetical protein
MPAGGDGFGGTRPGPRVAIALSRLDASTGPARYVDRALIGMEMGAPSVARPGGRWRPTPEGDRKGPRVSVSVVLEATRYLYRLSLVGSKLVEYQGFRRRACAGLRWVSQERYQRRFVRGLMAGLTGGLATRGWRPRLPWDPGPSPTRDCLGRNSAPDSLPVRVGKAACPGLDGDLPFVGRPDEQLLPASGPSVPPIETQMVRPRLTPDRPHVTFAALS